MVSFERSRFKLFSRKFSNKFVLAPSNERPKTALRTLLLSFETIIFFSNKRIVSQAFEKIWETCMPTW